MYCFFLSPCHLQEIRFVLCPVFLRLVWSHWFARDVLICLCVPFLAHGVFNVGLAWCSDRLLTAATYRDTEIRFAQRELTTYVYWTVHHLDSWIKIDQLMSLALFFAQHVSNVSTSSGACDCVWVYRSGSMCVGVTLWFGWGGVVSLCRLRHCLSLHKDTTYNSWIKIDQLMSLALFFAQHVSNASTYIFRSLRLCVGILLWFDVYLLLFILMENMIHFTF